MTQLKQETPIHDSFSPCVESQSTVIKPNENCTHPLDCNDGDSSSTLPLPPEKWPQRPILLRPTPGSGMKIRGIRQSSSKTYLPLTGMDRCALPINDGSEKPGECLLIDFESDLFIGTVMIRIKNVSPLQINHSDEHQTPTKNEAATNYFTGKKRTFNCVIRGRFKVPDIPISECVTGQVFNHPAENLPPWYVTQGAITIISYFAPQLQTRLDGDCPRFLSPLVSTAQTAMSYSANEDSSDADQSIEAEMIEPQPSEESSLLRHLYDIPSEMPPDSDSISDRRQARKIEFNNLYANGDKEPTFDPNLEYTFEFLQHLLLFDEFALDLMNPVGKIPLHGVLNGQPLKIIGAQQVRANQYDEVMRWLWSFDLWHEGLYEDARAREED